MLNVFKKNFCTIYFIVDILFFIELRYNYKSFIDVKHLSLPTGVNNNNNIEKIDKIENNSITVNSYYY